MPSGRPALGAIAAALAIRAPELNAKTPGARPGVWQSVAAQLW